MNVGSTGDLCRLKRFGQEWVKAVRLLASSPTFHQVLTCSGGTCGRQLQNWQHGGGLAEHPVSH